MMRLLLASSLSLVLSTTAFAHEHCDCSKDCQSKCQQGHGENCKCHNCDCAKTRKCDHHQCKMQPKPKDEEK